MTGLSALNLPQPLVWIVAFAIIFGLLAAFAHLLKRIAGSRAAELEGGRTRLPRLGLVDRFDLDRHRKLLIVRRDNVEHLILVGPTDVVVESNIVRAAGAVPLREDRGITPPATAQAAPGAASLPIPPLPATPGAMQGTTAPSASPLTTPSAPTVTQPAMPAAPFPVAPSRSDPARKSTMPPPPPYGAPKRSPQSGQARVEPVMGVPGFPVAPDKPAVPLAEPASDPLVLEAEIKAAEPRQPLPPEPMRVVVPTADAPKPASAKPDVPKPEPLKPEAFKPEPLKPETPKAEPPTPPAATAGPLRAEPIKPTAPVSEPVATASKALETDPLLADLSSKLQEVLKAQPRAEPAAERPPLPPFPPGPPNPAPAKPATPPAKPALEVEIPAPPQPVVEIVLNPETKPVEAVTPPPQPADAFEEELRRILGRVPAKN